MKQIISILIVILLLSGCAKVSQEDIPCSGSTPPSPSIPNQVLLLGSSTTITAGSPYTNNGIIYKWTGPKNLNKRLNPLLLDFTDSTSYGLYTVTAIINGCSSVPDTFYVTSNFTAAPSCTITPSQYNILLAPGVSSFPFSSPLPGQIGSLCNSSNYDINGTTDNGFTFDFYTTSRPVVGSYYNLTSDCNVGPGYAAAILSYYDQNGLNIYVFTSLSGRVYCNNIGGGNYITFCEDTFQRVSNGSKFVLTGNFNFY